MCLFEFQIIINIKKKKNFIGMFNGGFFTLYYIINIIAVFHIYLLNICGT